MLTVRLETVTPLFLAGADPRGKPELRAASIRGALRFWLRALLGGVIGDKDLNALRKAEAAVFGSTDTGASPVVVRIGGEVQFDSYRPLLHNPEKKFTFMGIQPDQAFSLELIPRPPHTQVSPIVLSVTALWLLLGGLGKRSRRGFGTLRLQNEVESFLFTPEAYKDASELETTLRQVIQQAQDQARNLISTLKIAPGTFRIPPDFPVLHSDHTQILFCKYPFATWEKAMMAFWRLLRSHPYRDDRVFGFAGSAGRQASPLHLRIVKIGNKYHLLMTAFRSRFAWSSPNWRKLQDFLSDCCQKWQGTWIMRGTAAW
ncbi:type III-B CRISPR module RAMP protein Cmr1 [Rhodothermus marinus]|uniref:type III-B CRISPR module RAMP protein Cmr1 n=1 Tax=Rhodothermus marinus TaxID=29549 RepID=UPI001374ED56